MDADIEFLNNECDEVEIDKEIGGDETIEEPMVGMQFSSIEEVHAYYMKYGKKKGFRVSKRNIRQDDDGTVRWFCLACTRGGTLKSTVANVMKPRQTVKMGCKARINAVLNVEGGYIISKVILDHTHACSPGKARHFRCFKKVDARVAKRLEINDKAGIRLSKNFKSVIVEAEGYENVTFGENECQNYIDKARRLRLGVGGGVALYARSRVMYESFGDVITFDTTYLTNAYKMPFALFMGVNHHEQSILVGCGLISNEDADTFEWLFQSWLQSHIVDTEKSKVPYIDAYMTLSVSMSLMNTGAYSAVRRKVENKAIANFNSFNTDIPCISRYPLEKQFQSAYTKEMGCGDGRYMFVVVDEVQIEQLKTQYPGIADHDTSNTVDTTPTTEASTPRVLSPLVVRSKGKPPSKRKVHPLRRVLRNPVRKVIAQQPS
ncbi:protein FAR-RED IMPAIRED RESPONSE 1-like [Juglans microcarpa x Juglans regia]|uniref:protein FAR-RED IMPAIRED RESPONSE 1-like n=1 Tax=Juglans microcarpa x Juglans regia TaxID=2249226 RepID=UPI001B7EB9C0|nr:protein FAR-RED IMPAIRED RESPONSE 1-like [Juglans microcarpa x Juglans regia]